MIHYNNKAYTFSDTARAFFHAIPPLVLFGLAAKFAVSPLAPIVAVGIACAQEIRGRKANKRYFKALDYIAEKLPYNSSRATEVRQFLQRSSAELGIQSPLLIVNSIDFNRKLSSIIDQTEDSTLKSSLIQARRSFAGSILGCSEASACWDKAIIIDQHLLEKEDLKKLKAKLGHELGHAAGRHLEVGSLLKMITRASYLFFPAVNFALGVGDAFGLPSIGESLLAVGKEAVIGGLFYLSVVPAAFFLKMYEHSTEYHADRNSGRLMRNPLILRDCLKEIFCREKKFLSEMGVDQDDDAFSRQKQGFLKRIWNFEHPLEIKRMARLERMARSFSLKSQHL